MQKITLKQVERAMASWSIMYREAGYTADELSFLSRQYFEDIVGEIPAKNFETTIRKVRQSCRFFPKVADILSAYSEVKVDETTPASHQIADTSLMHDPTKEEIEQDGKRLAIIKRAISGEITYEEATKQLEEWAA